MNRAQRLWTVAGLLCGAVILACYFLQFATMTESLVQQWRLLIPFGMKLSNVRVVMGSNHHIRNEFLGTTTSEQQIAEILDTKVPPQGFLLLGVDYALNPQTGDALHISGDAWQPIAKGNVVADKRSGGWKIFDGQSWIPFPSPFRRYEPGLYVRDGRDVKVATLLGIALPLVLVCASGFVAWGGRRTR